MTLQHLRSSTANKRPDPTAMADGQIALNTAAASPGLFYKDSAGNLVKAGPVHVGSTAPNVSPASGGTAGNSTGEAWLDTSGSNPLLKIWSGAAWQTVQPVASGTVVSTADTGSVTSTMIANGTIVDADVNASAAIAGTKVSPNFGSQTITTTGVVSAAAGAAATPSITFTGDLNTGIYSPGADQVAVATNGTGRLFVDASGRVGVGATPTGTGQLHIINAAGNVVSQFLSQPSGTCTIYLGTTSAADSFLQYDDASSYLRWFEGGSERLRIDSSGRVGIGTSAPNRTLHVYGDQAFSNSNNTGTLLFAPAASANYIYSRAADNAITAVPLAIAMGSTDVVRIDTSGRVGIGTTTVDEKLHLEGSSGANTNIKVESTTTGSERSSIEFWNGTISRGRVGGDNTFDGLTLDSSTTSGTSVIRFRTAGGSGFNEKARLDASGRLLVGTSSDSQASTLVLQGNSGASNDSSVIRLCRGTNAPVDGAVLGYLVWGDSGHIAAAWVAGARDGGTWTSGTSQPTRLVFSTTADGASSPTERMSIDNNGYIFPDATSRSYKASVQITSPGLKLLASSLNTGVRFEGFTDSSANRYHAAFSNTNGIVGTISTSGSATAYNTSSDYRLKENVTAVTDGITRLQQLNPSRFNFITDPAKTVDGFIAHEVQDIVPEAITGEKDAVDDDGNPVYQGIDQSKLVPLLTAALQEAIGEIESLKARLTAAGI